MAVAVNAIASESVQERINHQMVKALMSSDKIRAEQGLRVARSGRPMAEAFLNFQFELDDIWDCARGFAYGLQFNPNVEGTCYQSIDSSLVALDSIQDLLLKSYLPQSWAPIMSQFNNLQTFAAGVISNCDFQKLLSTITTPPSQSIPAMVARVGGGFIYEIPNIYVQLKKADTCFDFTRRLAGLFSLVFDYYI